MVFIEDARRAPDVVMVCGRALPREVQDPIDVCLRNRVLGRCWRHTSQTFELLDRGLAYLVGHRVRLDLGAQLFDLAAGLVDVAQLLANGLHLLAQIVLALLAVHFFADVALQLFTQLQNLHLMTQHLLQLLVALAHGKGFQEILFFRHAEVDVCSNEVRQRPGVLRVVDQRLELIGYVLGSIHQLRKRVADVFHERTNAPRYTGPIGLNAHPCRQVRLA